MHDVIVIDDVVNKEIQDIIEKTIFSKHTNWIFSRTVFYGNHPEVDINQRNSLMAFTHPIKDGDIGLCDENYKLYHSVLDGITNNILHSRIQLQLPVITEIHKKYGVPHVDGYRPFPYKVAVYYVNESDGPTILFKQTTKTSTPEDIKNGLFEIDTEIKPKKGRLVIFDGDIYHAVGKPKTDLRCIINYNFI